MFLMGGLTGPKRYNRAKLDAYECGIEPTPLPAGTDRYAQLALIQTLGLAGWAPPAGRSRIKRAAR